jgi:hypothetical protein
MFVLADGMSSSMLRKVPGGCVWALTLLPKRLVAWWSRKSTKEVLIESLQKANMFEEWEAAAFQLDETLGYDLWQVNSTDSPNASC